MSSCQLEFGHPVAPGIEGGSPAVAERNARVFRSLGRKRETPGSEKREGRRLAAPARHSSAKAIPYGQLKLLCPRPLTVSVIVTSVNTTVIGGTQSGVNAAVTVRQ